MNWYYAFWRNIVVSESSFQRKIKVFWFNCVSPNIVDVNGNKTAVILSIELYEQMLEDIHDLAIVAERRSEASISLAEMKKRLNSHETLSN